MITNINNINILRTPKRVGIERTGIMKVKTQGLKYEKAEFGLTQGHKNGERQRYEGGSFVNPRGYGWATESSPSTLILKIYKDDSYIPVRVDTYFRQTWKRLTQKRIEAIYDTCPDEVDIIMRYGEYAVSEVDLERWMRNAKALI